MDNQWILTCGYGLWRTDRTLSRQERPTTAHNTRTIRANLGYVRPEKRTVRSRRTGRPGPRPLGATLGATGANDLLGFRTAMNNGQGRDRGHVLIGTRPADRTWNYGSALVPLARRRTGVKNGGGTARDVVAFLVRSRPRISLTPGTGLSRGRSLSPRARGSDSPLAPGSPGGTTWQVSKCRRAEVRDAWKR